MTRLAFIDTETTSLRPDRRAWEIGLIVRDPFAGEYDIEKEHRWFVAADDLDLGSADLMALKVGRFHERHPGFSLRAAAAIPPVGSEIEILAQVEELTRGAHLVGAVVSFDAEVLAARMRANGICPSWHYHLIDVEALAAGFLAQWAASGRRGLNPAPASPDEDWPHEPPWDSAELSRLVGVDPDAFDRHTALGDARWARAIYDAVTGGAR